MTDIVFSANAVVGQYTYDIRPLGDGIQIMFRFANGAGVSVVRHAGSYGSSSGLWEAAPVIFNSKGYYDWDFIGMAFELPGYAGRDDVRGWLEPSEVDEILSMVSAL